MRYLALAFAGLICSASASAETVTYEFSGIVNKIRQSPTGNYNDSRSVASTTAVQGGLAVGDTYHGSFTLDLSTPNSSADTTNGYYWAWPSQTAMTVTFDKSGTVFQNVWAPSVSVSDSTFDSFSVLASAEGGYAHMWLYDPSANVFSSIAQPSSLVADDFHTADLDFYWYWTSNSPTVDVETSLLSITKVSAVPEPSTYAMLFAGLVLVGGAAARKRARKD